MGRGDDQFVVGCYTRYPPDITIGCPGGVIEGKFNLTILIQSFIWIGLALLGYFVQGKIGY